jgi:hypothetical protein
VVDAYEMNRQKVEVLKAFAGAASHKRKYQQVNFC